MAARRYMFRAPSGVWFYKRQLSNRKWFNRSLLSHIESKAVQEWDHRHEQFERENKRLRARELFGKDERREHLWQAFARFLIAQRAANGGRLPMPPKSTPPTSTRMASHAFAHIRGAFRMWAHDNDPVAEELFVLGDVVEEPLFATGIVAAWFTVMSMERIDQQHDQTHVGLTKPRLV